MTGCERVVAAVAGRHVCCDVGMNRLARVVRCVAFGCLSQRMIGVRMPEWRSDEGRGQRGTLHHSTELSGHALILGAF